MNKQYKLHIMMEKVTEIINYHSELLTVNKLHGFSRMQWVHRLSDGRLTINKLHGLGLNAKGSPTLDGSTQLVYIRYLTLSVYR